MITEDEVMRLLERVDRVRDRRAAPTADAADYLDALRTRSTTVTLIDTDRPPAEPASNRRWPIAAAAAALVVIGGGAIVLAARDDTTEPKTPSVDPITVASETTEALEIARGFINWRHEDPDRAMSHLTDDIIAETSGTRDDFRLEGAMLDALGTNNVNVRCQIQDQSASGIVVLCTYDNFTFRSEELVRVPFTGGFDTFTVRDGTIVSLGDSRNPDGSNEYFNETWNRFRQWVTTEHPDDVPKMYEGSGWRLTEESIALFEQHSLEYAEDHTVGFIGLPPEGATPSTPESGQVVLDIQSCLTPSGEPHEIDGWNGELAVFADGRLIWLQYDDLPAGANSLSTGLLEQRLTPEGVELMRSELVANGLDNSGDQPDCDAGTYHVHLYDGDRYLSHFTSGANEHLARITDPWSWLPATAWKDREIRAYVPSKYEVTFTGDMPSSRSRRIELDLLTAHLPAAAKDLIGTKDWDYQQAGKFWHYAEFTTEEARALAVALDDARLERDEQSNEYRLEYHFEYQDPNWGTVVHIVFRPLYPDDRPSG